ncbi:MAG: ubiquinone/menaquinone biosynthesis methyltransferase [Gemmatimonadetes bacterium]|nr:ubiquinone/menaquinone biosynthesis methyltransferase [Gemmatimonadota bacterium]
MSTTRRLRRMRLAEHLDDPRTKQRFVTTVFEVVSGSYDRFTRVFSYGMDAAWKRELLAELAAGIAPDAWVLDLACGTGDITLGAGQLVPAGRTVGLDISSGMLEVAKARARTESVSGTSFCRGDMMHLGLPDASVDAVTVSYGIRNAPDYGGALDEITRVLKTGGLLLTLDFYRPANPVWRRAFLGYMWLAGSAFGWLWHRAAVAYGYIAPSIERHVSWQEFSGALQTRGFVVDQVHRKLFGGICIHVARLRRRAG